MKKCIEFPYFHRIIEWFVLERPLKIIYSKVSMAGYAPVTRLLQPHQISQRSVQADLECFRNGASRTSLGNLLYPS